MKKTVKRLLVILLSLLTVTGSSGVSVYAEETITLKDELESCEDAETVSEMKSYKETESISETESTEELEKNNREVKNYSETTTANGKEATCQVDVQSVVEAENIEFEESEIVLNDEHSRTFMKVNFTPENVTDTNIEYISSNPDAVIVEGSDIIAVGVGTAVITGKTANGKTATCNVTVEESYPYGTRDGVQYELSGNTAKVVGCVGNLAEYIELVIPESVVFNGKEYVVTSIGDNAFTGYQSLFFMTSIHIPASVVSIGEYIFEMFIGSDDYFCRDLTTMIMDGDAPEVSTDFFVPHTQMSIRPVDKEITISVPYGAKGYDKFPWTNYKVVYREPEQKLSPTENLKAVSAGKQKVKLTWSAVEGAEGYLIYGQKNGQYGYVGMTTKGTVYTDVTALDTDYNFYWVFPYVRDGNGKMLPGGCKKYVYAKGVCPAVTNLKAASGAGQVKLTWKASAGAEGYLIYGKTATGKYEYKGMTTKGTTYVHKSASKTEYNFYWVFPYHKDAKGKMIVGGTPKYVYGKAR
ncbi:hypothetical protein [Frisingicoccus sp.]|uniref:hypothetical protein n=1 Tax=Frisingicoccus sp. TaxID=1918627 RepID=UPI003AB377E3